MGLTAMAFAAAQPVPAAKGSVITSHANGGSDYFASMYRGYVFSRGHFLSSRSARPGADWSQ